MFQRSLVHELPDGSIVRRAKEGVGGVIEQLYTNRVERSRATVAEEAQNLGAAVLQGCGGECPVRRPIFATAGRTRASLRIDWAANQVGILGDATTIDGHSPYEDGERFGL